ncbi:MAG: AAA family ATPase [Rubrivivax sp.]|nr:AAA family ATPase [Rubrivivax sp.]
MTTSPRQAIWSPEVEQALLGAGLLDQSVCALPVEAKHFHDENHGLIWAAMRHLHRLGTEFDLVSVFQLLQSRGQDERCGGLQYLNALFNSVPSARAASTHAALIVEHARRRRVEAGGLAVQQAAAELTGEALENRVAVLVRELAAGLASTERDDDAAPLFAVVPLADLAQAVPEPAGDWWQGYMPPSVVTLLGAHGGTGKSMLALMLGVCISIGMSMLGIPTRRGKVAFFSGEDGAELVRHRLSWICRQMAVEVAALDGRLHVLDATAGEPALYHEVSIAGRRHGLTTPSYAALRDYIDAQGIDVLIVDNASDTYDASEIDRARVRGFMRSLARIAQDRAGAVLLLAHVDKGTSRGDRQGTEGYSGSTAWHNSARSRLYLSRDRDGALLLEHQKHNLGKLAEPLRLTWPEGGLPQRDQPFGAVVQHIADGNDTKELLRLVHAFHARGEFIATDTRSRYHAGKVLADEPTFPRRRKPAEVFELLRYAEARGWIERQAYRDRNRKEHERWALTGDGCRHIGVAAPCAPCAPSSENGALVHPAQQGAPCAPCGVQGVRGSRARTESGADGGELGTA